MDLHAVRSVAVVVAKTKLRIQIVLFSCEHLKIPKTRSWQNPSSADAKSQNVVKDTAIVIKQEYLVPTSAAVICAHVQTKKTANTRIKEKSLTNNQRSQNKKM